MNPELLKEISIRQLHPSETIPYTLLQDADPSLEVISHYIQASEIYLAFLRHEVIGVFVLYPVDAQTLEIKNIAVEESLQGNGIGTLLLDRATHIASTKKFKTLVIGTSNASIGQLYLYQKNGFEMTGIKTDFFLDHYPEAIFENGIQCKHMIMLAKQL